MGNIQILRDFFSPVENTERTIRIFTPNAYDENPNQHFPVLYMFDGQNIFAHPESAVYDTWCVNETIENLVADGSISPWIVVGIDNLTDRVTEYSPWDDRQGHLTSKFLIHHLKPYIDQTYRTRPEPEWTSIMGSSMGGQFALYLGKTFPEIFGRIGGISPALMWGDGKMLQYWDKHTQRWSKIYLYVGEKEQYPFYGDWLDYVPLTCKLYEHLKEIGYSDHELQFKLAEEEVHHETAWQRQIPDIFRWLLADTIDDSQDEPEAVETSEDSTDPAPENPSEAVNGTTPTSEDFSYLVEVMEEDARVHRV